MAKGSTRDVAMGGVEAGQHWESEAQACKFFSCQSMNISSRVTVIIKVKCASDSEFSVRNYFVLSSNRTAPIMVFIISHV